MGQPALASKPRSVAGNGVPARAILDAKINHCQKQTEKTEQYKKGLLQKMFI